MELEWIIRYIRFRLTRGVVIYATFELSTIDLQVPWKSILYGINENCQSNSKMTIPVRYYLESLVIS